MHLYTYYSRYFTHSVFWWYSARTSKALLHVPDVPSNSCSLIHHQDWPVQSGSLVLKDSSGPHH